MILGTFAYMSPEQASGRPVDARSDIFAFGVLLYEMLTGQRPFRGKTTLETLSAIRELEPEAPTRLVPGLPPEAERAASVLVVAGVAALVRLRRSPPAEPSPFELNRLTYDGGAALQPSLSPDGRLVAYASDRGGDGHLDLWVRHVAQPEPARLTDDPTDDWMPTFAPDGSQVVFRSERDGGGIYVVNTLGGAARTPSPCCTPTGAA